MATPATPNLVDQLKALHESLEYANRTAEVIKDQRNLLKEVANQARLVGVEFNKHTENIGASVKEIKLFEATETDLQNAIRDRNVVESSLLKQLKIRSATEQQLNLVRRMADKSTSDAAIVEIEDKKRLINEQINDGQLDRKLGEDQIIRLNDIKSVNGDSAKQMIAALKEQTGHQDAYIVRTKDNLRLENVALDKLKVKNGFMQLGKKVLGDMGPLGEKIISSKSINAATLIVAILEQGFKNFLAFDKAAVSVRSNLGALPGQANQLESLIKQVGIESMHLGVTFDDVAKSINEITNEFTGLVAQDTDLLKITTALSKQFGIAEVTSVKFLKTLGGISGNSASSQRSMIGFAQKMAQASGVPLGKIMQDVAEASDDVRIYVGSSAVSMIKAATAARMLGIDMNKAAATAEKLLQFESSIASELKASALLGQNVNFNYARRLFFNKNIIDGNKEILRITKQVNFNQLDPIKQKAYADAAGKSVGELQDMLQQEKNIQLVKNGTNEKAKKVLVDYERMMQLKDEEAKNEGKLAEKQILQMANQERLVQIQNQFNKLMSELSKPVMDIVEPLLDLAIKYLPTILVNIKYFGGLILGVGKGIGYIATKLSNLITVTSATTVPLSRTSKILLSIGKLLLPILSTFGRWLNPIGWVITALMGIKSLMGGIAKYWDESADWPSKMWTGLKLLTKAIIEAFLPFDTVRKNLDEWFFGKSPSKAGKLIAKGFSSIGPELQDSLVTPVNKAYDEIKNISPPEIKVTGGFSSIGSKLQDSLITSVNKAYGEIKNISPPEINVDSATTNKLVETTDNTLISVIKTSNQQLVAKLDQLIAMMANGGIAVNLDGQKINASLSTSKIKSGGFGQATMA